MTHDQIVGDKLLMARIWKVQETGTVGSVTVNTSDANAEFLLISDSTDFSSATSYSLTSGSTSVDFNIGEFFTLASSYGLTAPTNLTATATSQTQIDLAWTDESSDETGFKIFRDGVELTPSPIAAADSTTFSDTNLTCDTTYNYEVKATNVNVDSSGITASTTTQACPPPNAPTGLTATPASQTQIDLSWADNSSDETGFKIFRDGVELTPSPIAAADSTTFSDTNLTCDTTYNYEVKATNVNVDSSGITASTTTQACPTSSSSGGSSALPSTMTLTLEMAGKGSGTVTITPGSNSKNAITCHTTDSECQNTLNTGIKLALTAEPDNGSEFSSWSGHGDCSKESFFITSNRLCTVYFQLGPRTLTIEPAEQGTISSQPDGILCGPNAQSCEAEFDGSTKITLTATPIDGWLFENWEGDGCEESITLNENVTCQPVFVEKTTTSTSGTTTDDSGTTTTDSGTATDDSGTTTDDSGNDSGTTTDDSGTTTDDSGTTTTDSGTATDDSGNDSGTTTDDSGNDSGTTTDDSGTETSEDTSTETETTVFSLEMEILGDGKVISTPEGIDCGNDCTAEFAEQSQIILTAMPLSGFQLSGWGQDCSGLENPLAITLDNSRYCTATFEALPPESVDIELPPSEESVIPETPSEPVEPEDPVVEKPVTNVPVETESTVVEAEVEEEPETTEETETILSPAPLPLSPITATIPAVMKPCYDREGWLDDEKWLNWTCHAQGHTLPGDLKVRPKGHLSYVVVETIIENYGWFSNSVIKKTGIVRGGIVTGYISSEGRLEDFDFRGRSIIGGMLAGKILNNSEVGGYFQDVLLAAQTEIQGGTLKGKIEGDETGPALLENVKIAGGTVLKHVTLGENVRILLDSIVLENVFLGPNVQLNHGQIQGNLVGDPEAPAQLDNIIVKPGSFLDNVIIGPTVKGITDEVTLGDNVKFVKPLIEETSTDTQEESSSEIQEEIVTDSQTEETSTEESEETQTQCKTKAQAITLDSDETVDSSACFTGKFDINGVEKNNGAKLSKTDAKKLNISITINPLFGQIGFSAKILMVGVYQAADGTGTAYCRHGKDDWQTWDGEVGNLTTAQEVDTLPENLEVSIFDGDLSSMPGSFTVYIGFQLEDGTIHYNGVVPMRFEVE
jgi:hypothetical protein